VAPGSRSDEADLLVAQLARIATMLVSAALVALGLRLLTRAGASCGPR